MKVNAAVLNIADIKQKMSVLCTFSKQIVERKQNISITMNYIFKEIAIMLFLFLCIQLNAQTSQININYNGAYAFYNNGRLKVGNVHIERQWDWCSEGLKTIAINDKKGGKIYRAENNDGADWSLLPDMTMNDAKLVSVNATVNNDEGFTEEHIEVIIEISYPASDMQVKYKIWCFPNAPGLRTQFFVKSLKGLITENNSEKGLPKNRLKITSSVKHLTNPTIGEKWTTGEFNKGPQFVPEPEALLDGNILTYWRTVIEKQKPDKPIELILDLGDVQNVEAVGVTGPQDYGKVGCPEHVIVFASIDSLNWGKPIASTSFTRSRKEFMLNFKYKNARYIKLLFEATSHPNGINKWAGSLSEINIYTKEYPCQQIKNLQTDYVPVQNIEGYRRLFIGYEMDNQFRTTVDFSIYKEEIQTGLSGLNSFNDWANIMCIENEGKGLMLVKESHKTAIEPGYFTGAFSVGNNGIGLSGWGMAANEVSTEYKECWANWLIAYQGGEKDRSLALKIFDRQRFPLHLPGHKSINACTWGGGTSSRTNRDLGQEHNVLAEIESIADLGIECLGIDDGWQVGKEANDILPSKKNGWYPNKEVYPEGNWERVKNKAQANNVRLSLWTIAQSISDEELFWNQTNGGFQHWKFDFIDIDSYESRARVQSRIRTFIKEYNQNVSVVWDLTESIPRTGLFWMREYGFLWLANRRRNIESRNILYRPSNMLKILWDVSQSLNSNKLELALVDVRQVPAPSDASLHSMQYAIAIAITGIPMFFDYTRNYLPETRDEIKEFLPIYKQHRDWMHSSYAFPVGNRPNNDTMTGFQYYKEGDTTGYLMLFRELLCQKETGYFELAFVKNKTIFLTNLLTGEKLEKWVGNDGGFTVNINNPADFRWFKFHIQDTNQ